MTSQLDERPAQILTPAPERNESPSRSPTWRVATAVSASLALGAGLIVAVALTDGARSPAGEPERADASALEVNGGVLPAHLQEFEARVAAGSTERGVLPAHLEEFEARVAAGSTERGVLPAHLEEFEARVAADSSERGVLPAHLEEFEARVEADSSEAGEP